MENRSVSSVSVEIIVDDICGLDDAITPTQSNPVLASVYTWITGRRVAGKASHRALKSVR